MVNYSDILGKIAKKQGVKPSQPDSDSHIDLQRTRQVPLPESMVQSGSHPGLQGPLTDPTEQISRSVMARLFSSVLDTPAEAPVSRHSSNDAPAAAASQPAAQPRPSLLAPAPDRRAQSAKAEPVKGFRNHAELLKFASLLINDVEDMLKS